MSDNKKPQPAVMLAEVFSINNKEAVPGVTFTARA